MPERDPHPERGPYQYGLPSDRFEEIRRRGAAPVRSYPVTRQELREQAPGSEEPLRRTGGFSSRRDPYLASSFSTRDSGSYLGAQLVRPGTAGFYSSIPSPFAGLATNPPVILDRSDRRLAGPAAGQRGSRQLPADRQLLGSDPAGQGETGTLSGARGTSDAAASPNVSWWARLTANTASAQPGVPEKERGQRPAPVSAGRTALSTGPAGRSCRYGSAEAG